VVDGVQRLTTIHKFVQGDPLSDLEYIKKFEGCAFDQLDIVSRRRFQQTQIFVNVIEPQTPDDVKFDVFRRINTGGSPLTAQEIRHCMSRARSRDLLKRLITLPSFHEATDGAFHNERRMADREVALRFCAFHHLTDVDDYRRFGSLDAFLLAFTRRIDGVAGGEPPLDDDALDTIAATFDRAMGNAVVVFGKAAFRKYRVGAARRGPINRALFESWAVALAKYSEDDLAPHRDEIVQLAREKLEDYSYNAAITQGTGDLSAIKKRFEVAQEIIADAVHRKSGE
jgi:hypothetical protein